MDEDDGDAEPKRPLMDVFLEPRHIDHIVLGTRVDFPIAGEGIVDVPERHGARGGVQVASDPVKRLWDLGPLLHFEREFKQERVIFAAADLREAAIADG